MKKLKEWLLDIEAKRKEKNKEEAEIPYDFIDLN